MDNVGEGVTMIAGERVHLREIEEEDLEIIVRWRNDPEIVKWLFSYLPLCMAKQRRWYQSYVEDNTRQIFVIEVEKKPVGTIGLSCIDYRNQNGELGILIDKEWQEKGIGKESLSLLIEFAWNEMNLRKIKVKVFKENEAAINLYKSCGFTEEGILKKEIYKNGEFKDVMIMAVMRW